MSRNCAKSFKYIKYRKHVELTILSNTRVPFPIFNLKTSNKKYINDKNNDSYNNNNNDKIIIK